jgi:hypothetical protein
MPFWAHLLLTIVMELVWGGMNVMHDGNRSPILINHGSINSWVVLYVLAGNVYNWQVHNNNVTPYLHQHSGHDEDLDAGRVIVLEAKWYNFHRFHNIILFSWIIDFQLGYHNRFQTDEKLLEKKTIKKLKAKKHFGLL